MPWLKDKHFHVLLIYSLNKHLCFYYVRTCSVFRTCLVLKGTIVKKIGKDQESREHILADDVKYKKRDSMKKKKAEGRK